MKNKRLLLIILLLAFAFCSTAQHTKPSFMQDDIFQTAYFIENKGQFDKHAQNEQPIRYGVENGADQIYFNRKGCVWKLKTLSHEKPNKPVQESDEEEEHKNFVESEIFMEWLHSNPACRLESEGKSSHYFTYGEKKYCSYGYEKIIYKNIYPHIDIEYIIPKLGGIKYSLILHTGANIHDVKFAYKGSQADVTQQGDTLQIRNDICDVLESGLRAFYTDGTAIDCKYDIAGNEIGFEFTEPTDNTKDIVIDPWVTQITSLTSTAPNCNNKGYDVDYDYQGNLYVYGGGGGSQNPKVAKYSATGILLWTFNGIVVTPAWTSSGSVGNFAVDKLSSKAYIGQGFAGGGSRVVRLDINGVYDNFISTAVPSFREIWEMNFDCNTGNMLLMGGSTNSNSSIALMDASGILTVNSLSGIATFNQDILSSTVAPNGEVFVAMASLASATLNNRMLKLNTTFNGNSWIAPTGYSAFTEAGNKPYATGSSNGYNALHANNNYLYYYDGRRIKAFDKSSGLPVGTADSIITYTARWQGGIYADNCDNVYVGGRDGNLHVYHFNGSVFTALPDIVLTGTAGMNVHDIRYNNSDGLLYVTGDSLVATVPRSQVCIDSASLNITYVVDCTNAIVNLINADTTALYSYVWTDSNTNTIVQSHMNIAHLSDTLITLISGHVYHVLITKSDFCGSAVGAISFTASSNTYLSDNPVVCSGQSVTVNGHVYSSTGLYSDTLINGAGCDTIITTNLLVMPLDTFTQSVILCNGQSVNVNGNVYFTSGVYSDTATNMSGCDSIIHTNLTVLPMLISSQSISLCNGQSVTVNGHVYNSSGIYTDTLITASGCDSVVETNLLVRALDTTSQFVTLCNGESTTVNGHAYNNTGLYHDTLSNLFGCDSIVMTHVVVLPPVTSTENRTICAGQSAIINGHTYTMAGMYTDTLTNTSGCDTILTVILSITPAILASQYLNICGGKSIAVNGHTYQVAGTYVDSLVNAAGCDSVLTTVLEVDDSYEVHLYIPNAFTPNGDGHNDCFRILGQTDFKEFYMAIYNRWGQRVFEANNIQDCWEGDFKSREALDGVYYFFLRGKTECGDVFRKGDLILMR